VRDIPVPRPATVAISSGVPAAGAMASRISPRVMSARADVAGAERRGLWRACSAAGSLRAAGVPVEMIRTPHDCARGVSIHVVPWAPGLMVDLYRRLRRSRVGADVRREALREAWGLGRAGPMFEAAVVAGRMMG